MSNMTPFFLNRANRMIENRDKRIKELQEKIEVVRRELRTTEGLKAQARLHREMAELLEELASCQARPEIVQG